MFRSVFQHEYGSFTADGGENGIYRIWLPGSQPSPAADSTFPLPWDFIGQLEAFLAGKRKDWNLPYSLSGSSFQLSVWTACKEIPYGCTLTYKELACKIGASKAVRAVGQALASNPLPLIIPCHRVLPSDHSIGNYAGGPILKKLLLDIEQQNCFL